MNSEPEEKYLNGQVWESPNTYHQRIVFFTGKKNESGEWIYWLLGEPYETVSPTSRSAVSACADESGKKDYTLAELGIYLANWKLHPELGLELIEHRKIA